LFTGGYTSALVCVSWFVFKESSRKAFTFTWSNEVNLGFRKNENSSRCDDYGCSAPHCRNLSFVIFHLLFVIAGSFFHERGRRPGKLMWHPPPSHETSGAVGSLTEMPSLNSLSLNLYLRSQNAPAQVGQDAVDRPRAAGRRARAEGTHPKGKILSDVERKFLNRCGTPQQRQTKRPSGNRTAFSFKGE
jgi:hypothetical protein